MEGRGDTHRRVSATTAQLQMSSLDMPEADKKGGIKGAGLNAAVQAATDTSTRPTAVILSLMPHLQQPAQGVPLSQQLPHACH